MNTWLFLSQCYHNILNMLIFLEVLSTMVSGLSMSWQWSVISYSDSLLYYIAFKKLGEFSTVGWLSGRKFQRTCHWVFLVDSHFTHAKNRVDMFIFSKRCQSFRSHPHHPTVNFALHLVSHNQHGAAVASGAWCCAPGTTWAPGLLNDMFVDLQSHPTRLMRYYDIL